MSWVIGVWSLLCVALLVRGYLSPNRQTVFHNYSQAGRNWLAGTDAYEVPRDKAGRALPRMSGYRYSPLFSACSAPLAILSDAWGGLIWRMLNYAAYIAALIGFLRVMPGAERWNEHAVGMWFLLILPLSLPSMNNAQVNVLMLALMLAAAQAVLRERWNLAAFALAATFFMKLYPLALGMLFILVYPRQLGWRVAAALLIGLALPFALQNPAYVWDQYVTWYDLLRLDVRDEYLITDGYRDFFMLMRWLGLPMSVPLHALTQLSLAGLAAVLCLLGRLSGWPKQDLVHTIVLLGCCWIIVAGPATESCTYILLAPGLAWAIVDAFTQRRGIWTQAVLSAVLGMLLLNSIANWFAESRYWFYALQPLAALIFFLERCVHAALHLPGARRSLAAVGSRQVT